MRTLSATFFTLGLALAAPALADEPVHLDCSTGPVMKTYGGTSWKVFSCTDGQSLAFVADKTSKAAPFTFTLIRLPDGYDLTGRGDGDRKLAGAAYDELRQIKSSTVKQLIEETKHVGGGK